MNSGVVSSRYAKALLKFAQERGVGDKVYSQSLVLVSTFRSVPAFSGYVGNRQELSLDGKMRLLSAALDEPVCEELERFVRLVYSSGRMEFLSGMLESFIRMYRKANGIKVGRFVTAVRDADLCSRLENMLGDRTDAVVHLEADSDPALIGGFVLEIDDLRLDASVASQLRRIENSLTDKGNRIV